MHQECGREAAVSIDGPGREQLRTLAERLKEAGEEGQGFRRELMSKIDEAAQPLAEEIASLAHLRPYMPDRYAAVLAADINVRAQKIFASNPRVSVSCRTRGEHRRKVRLLDAGFINHPIFARGPREDWDWWNGQTGGMKPGFFTDPCVNATPAIREKVLESLTETARKIARG
jgi:hypothetical protein